MAKIFNNTTSLQEVLDTLQNKATPSGGTDTSDATATENDILKDKIAYARGKKIVGNIETKTADDLSVSGKTVTVPAGNYKNNVSKDVTTTTQATPNISVSTNGLITASAEQTEGYVEGGTKSATKQLTTQAAKTITPSTSSQTAVASGVYTTGDITVAAIPNTYVKPSSTKDATTYTPTTTNQTIAAGTYLTGIQTIKGDANLKAENIVKDKVIFGITGTAEAGGGDTTLEDAMVTGTLTTYTNDRVTSIGAYAFYYWYK